MTEYKKLSKIFLVGGIVSLIISFLLAYMPHIEKIASIVIFRSKREFYLNIALCLATGSLTAFISYHVTYKSLRLRTINELINLLNQLKNKLSSIADMKTNFVDLKEPNVSEGKVGFQKLIEKIQNDMVRAYTKVLYLCETILTPKFEELTNYKNKKLFNEMGDKLNIIYRAIQSYNSGIETPYNLEHLKQCIDGQRDAIKDNKFIEEIENIISKLSNI